MMENRRVINIYTSITKSQGIQQCFTCQTQLLTAGLSNDNDYQCLEKFLRPFFSGDSLEEFKKSFSESVVNLCGTCKARIKSAKNSVKEVIGVRESVMKTYGKLLEELKELEMTSDLAAFRLKKIADLSATEGKEIQDGDVFKNEIKKVCERFGQLQDSVKKGKTALDNFEFDFLNKRPNGKKDEGPASQARTLGFSGGEDQDPPAENVVKVENKPIQTNYKEVSHCTRLVAVEINPSEELTVGTFDCSIPDVAKIIKKSGSFPLLMRRWWQLGEELKINFVKLQEMEMDLLWKRKDLFGVVSDIIEEWVGGSRSDAKLTTLEKALREVGCRKIAEDLRDHFCSKTR